jgi:hypothetical protein
MCSRPFRPLGFAHLCRSRPRGSVHSPLPLRLYLDHSHCLVLAPATLAALPSTRAIETRSLPTSLAATHRGFAFYVASPKAPFPRSRRVLCLARRSLGEGGSFIPFTPFILLNFYLLLVVAAISGHAHSTLHIQHRKFVAKSAPAHASSFLLLNSYFASVASV